MFTVKNNLKFTIHDCKLSFFNQVDKAVLKTFLILLFIPAQLFATNYYIAANGNDNANGTSPSAAWKTISKLNESFWNMQPGDNIFFKRGDIFYGSIVINRSGTRESPITISAYGEGDAPVITGFATVDKWQPNANGIWEAIVDGVNPSVNLVVKDNLIQQVGRYPNRNTANGGYLTYNAVGGGTKNSETAFITSAQAIQKNWEGAEVVIKKKRWNIERDTIVSQNGNNIYYRQPHRGNVYPGIEGFGFFFQRHPSTLDQPGEWYYNPNEKKLLMYFGVQTPFTSIIKISTVDTLINIERNKNIIISNLSFEGANHAGVYSDFGAGITVSHCNFNFMGKDAVTLWQTPDAIVEYASVTNALGSGIFIRNSGSGGYNNSTVQYCKVKNICQFPGMEIPGDAAGRCGITVTGGDNVLIQFNTVDSAGYAGIEWQGNNVLVYSNVISNCLNVRDDGGGIYSYVGKGPSPKQYHNRIIRKNIILNCIGAVEGTGKEKSSARGIYCDEGSSNILIDSNTVANCSGAGLYANSVSNITMKRNVLYNNGQAFAIQRFQNAPPVRNIIIKQNWFFPYVAAYSNAQIDYPALTADEDIRQFAVIDSNYYSPAASTPFSFVTMKTGKKEYKEFSKTFVNWTKQAGFDKRSKKMAKSNSMVKFVYNASAETITVNLNGNYKDPKDGIFKSKIKLPPFSSYILTR